jgi:hypothetical protein
LYPSPYTLPPFKLGTQKKKLLISMGCFQFGLLPPVCGTAFALIEYQKKKIHDEE